MESRSEEVSKARGSQSQLAAVQAAKRIPGPGGTEKWLNSDNTSGIERFHFIFLFDNF